MATGEGRATQQLDATSNTAVVQASPSMRELGYPPPDWDKAVRDQGSVVRWKCGRLKLQYALTYSSALGDAASDRSHCSTPD